MTKQIFPSFYRLTGSNFQISCFYYRPFTGRRKRMRDQLPQEHSQQWKPDNTMLIQRKEWEGGGKWK